MRADPKPDHGIAGAEDPSKAEFGFRKAAAQKRYGSRGGGPAAAGKLRSEVAKKRIAISVGDTNNRRMTTQEKTDAIQKIVANRKDNRAAAAAVGIEAELSDLVNEAMNNAFKADLESVFAYKPPKTRKGK